MNFERKLNVQLVQYFFACFTITFNPFYSSQNYLHIQGITNALLESAYMFGIHLKNQKHLQLLHITKMIYHQAPGISDSHKKYIKIIPSASTYTIIDTQKDYTQLMQNQRESTIFLIVSPFHKIIIIPS